MKLVTLTFHNYESGDFFCGHMFPYYAITSRIIVFKGSNIKTLNITTSLFSINALTGPETGNPDFEKNI